MAVARHGRRGIGFAYWTAVAVLKPTLVLLTKSERRGDDNLRETYPGDDGIVVATNHLSWFDPMNVSHTLWDDGRPPRFLAKEALFRVPLLGWIIRNAGQIPVFRESEDAAAAISAGIEAIHQGEAVVVYVEGTLTRDEDLWPMTGKTGAAHISLVTGCPVIPMAQWGPQEVMRPYVKEIRLLPRKTMHSNIGPPVDLDDLRDREITNELLEEATARIVNAITGLLEELRDQKAPPERLDFKEWKAKQTAAAEPAGLDDSSEPNGSTEVATGADE